MYCLQMEFKVSGTVQLKSNYNLANDVAVCVAGRVCGNRLLQRLMSPSPKSQVMFVFAFS